MSIIRTEDRATLTAGDYAYNYYDRKPGTIGQVDSLGWFDFAHDDGTTAYLDGSRICTIATAIAKGWVKPTASLPVDACAFCGNIATIHADSEAQYGEPVCVDCYGESFTTDPTNEEA